MLARLQYALDAIAAYRTAGKSLFDSANLEKKEPSPLLRSRSSIGSIHGR